MKAHEKTLSQYIGKANVQGDVGIEIEVEGKNLVSPDDTPVRWTRHEDGSLRNGAEYVFTNPLPIDQVPDAMARLNKAFEENGTKLDFSFRTSVHVHVNCLDLNHVQICNFMYTYLLLEPVMMEYAGDARKGNRFCLRLEDADGVLMLLEELFRSWEEGVNTLGQNIIKNANRYAAMNVESLVDHGTLEFRSMRGTNDAGIIVPWANVLYAIKQFARAQTSPHHIYELLHRDGVHAFAHNIFKGYEELFLYEGYEDDVNMYASYTIDLPFYFRDFDKKNKEAPAKEAKAKKAPAYELNWGQAAQGFQPARDLAEPLEEFLNRPAEEVPNNRRGFVGENELQRVLLRHPEQAHQVAGDVRRFPEKIRRMINEDRARLGLQPV